MAIPFQTVGFDLDGTLLDTFRDLRASVNHALALGGFAPVPVETSQGLIGGGAKLMLAQAVNAQGGIPGGLEGNDFRALYKSMLRYYSEHNAVYSKPYPHAREVVAELVEQGITVCVVTNKFENFARSILTQLDFIEPFKTIIGGDSMGKGPDGAFLSKPHPEPIIEARVRCAADPSEPRAFVFVGDSTYDVKAAKAASVPVVGAAYGYCDKPPAELGADVVIDSLDALIPALEGL